MHCFESQSNGLFPFCFHVSILLADQFHISVFQNIYFTSLTAKRKRNTLKGVVKGSLRKKQFIQQGEMAKKAMSEKWADHSYLRSSKMQERNSFAVSFPMCRKYSHIAMSYSPHGPQSSKHTGQKFNLSWRG